MSAVFFEDQTEFRQWLEKNHDKETELLVGFYKKNSGRQNMTWSQSVDEALCFGWIDSVRRSINEDSYCIRFTPRKKTSIWSNVNIGKVEMLTKSKRMHPSGIEAFMQRKEEKSNRYSFENNAPVLPENFEKIFRSNKKAWEFFNAQPPSYRKTIIYWILSAKQEKTRFSRLQKTVAESEHQKRVYN